jgi:hypothetical protein
MTVLGTVDVHLMGHVSATLGFMERTVQTRGVANHACMESVMQKLVSVRALLVISQLIVPRKLALAVSPAAMITSASVASRGIRNATIPLGNVTVCPVCREQTTFFQPIARSGNVLGSATTRANPAHARGMASATTIQGNVSAWMDTWETIVVLLPQWTVSQRSWVSSSEAKCMVRIDLP